MKSIATPSTSNYEFTDTDAGKLYIARNKGRTTFYLGEHLFPNADAPAVALAIITAAGFVPRGNRADSDSFQESVDTAAGYLDDAVLIQAGTAAKAELTRRRDELARQIYLSAIGEDDGGSYKHRNPITQTAIDMIIQLQDEAAK